MNPTPHRRYDVPLILLTVALVAFGLLMVYSASAYDASEAYEDSLHFVVRQGVAVAVGVVALLTLARTPYRRLRKYAPALYGIAVAALCLVWIPTIGHAANGAHRWFGVGGVNFQPAELAKLVILVGLAAWLHRNRADIHDPRVLLLAAAGLAPPLLLILLQPDFGSTLIICLLVGVMFFLAGLRWSWIAALATAGVTLLGVIMVAEPYRRDRLTAFLDPFKHCNDESYQVCQSLVALHNGGLFGQGVGASQAKLAFLPEPHNDFIAAVVGEEYGLLGILGLLLAFGLFAARGFQIARRAPDGFGALLAATLTIMIVGQACLNLGVVMSVVPPKGLVLPFLSYGSSAMEVNLAAVGILLAIGAESTVPAARPAPSPAVVV